MSFAFVVSVICFDITNIKYRKISKIEYYIARSLWKWVDDDSNHDTMSGKDRTAEGMVYGNAFDLGDARAEYPQFEWKESFDWFLRNTGYNSNYMDEECAENDPKYFYYLTKREHWTPVVKEGKYFNYIKPLSIFNDCDVVGDGIGSPISSSSDAQDYFLTIKIDTTCSTPNLIQP